MLRGGSHGSPYNPKAVQTMAAGYCSRQDNQRKIAQYMSNVYMENLSCFVHVKYFRTVVYSGVEIFRSFRKYKKNKCLPICFTGPVCSHILTREGHLRRENYSPLCFPTIAIVRDWLLNSHKGQASRDVAQSWLERKGYGCFEETSERSVETVRHIFTSQLSNSTSRYLIQK